MKNRNPAVHQEKRLLRESFLNKRLNITETARVKHDAAIARHLINLATYRYADTVLLYAATKGEVSTWQVFDNASESGKTIYFPRCCIGEEGAMEFHKVTCLSQLEEGRFGLREPSPSLPPLSQQDHGCLTLCVVPALAFDNEGYRLGYGKGYYDRFLANFDGKTVGIIYDELLIHQLPRGFFDLPVDFLITPSGVKIFREG